MSIKIHQRVIYMIACARQKQQEAEACMAQAKELERRALELIQKHCWVQNCYFACIQK